MKQTTGLERIFIMMASLAGLALIGVCLYFLAKVDLSQRGCCCHTFPEDMCRNPLDEYPYYDPSYCGLPGAGSPVRGACMACNPGITEWRCSIGNITCQNYDLHPNSTCSWFESEEHTLESYQSACPSNMDLLNDEDWTAILPNRTCASNIEGWKDFDLYHPSRKL